MSRRRRSLVLGVVLAAATTVPVLRSTPAGADTEAVRTRLLGSGWDAPDAIRIRWLSITTVLASFGGHVVLFDATVMNHLFQAEDRTDHVSLDEVIAARPEHVLVDHVHPDQSRHLARIAVASGASVTGSVEACNFARRDALVKGLDADKVKCNLVRDAGGEPFDGLGTWVSPVEPPIFTPWGTFGKPETVPDGLEVQAVKIKHTQNRPYPDGLTGPEGYRPDMSPYDAPPDPQATADFLTSWDDDGTNLLWVLTYRDFTLVKHGSTSSLDPIEPGQREIREALGRLGAAERVDLEIGGIAELQNYTTGLLDARRYATEIGAKVFMPIHHGNWAPPFTSDAVHYQEPWQAQVAEMDAARRPEVCFLVEETRATVFALQAGDWAGAAKGSLTPLGGPGCHGG